MSTPITHTFSHSLLGPLTGLTTNPFPSTPNSTVTHFRSIPFASIPARFQQSILLTRISASHTRSFTSYSTACTAPPQLDQTAAAGGLLPGEDEKKYDEMSCLNLTISAPTPSLASLRGIEDREGLPVMVYVHGGAFAVGSGHVNALNGNYRLNWFGFLACNDLLLEAQSLNQPPCNFGLHNQRTAFLWIHRFTAGFGGSPTNVTAFGESAGSGSIAMHMCSSVPLFNRAIFMSGTGAAGPPVEMKYKEAEYLALLKYCEIEEKDPQRLELLRGISEEKLVKAIRGLGIPLLRGLRDSEFWPRGFPSYYTEGELIAGCDWVHEMIIGDAFFEGSFLMPSLRTVSCDDFIAISHEVLGASNAIKLLSAYNITPNIDPNLFWTNLSYLMGDIIFSSPTHNLAQLLASSSDKKIYRYTQTMRNPFPGSPLYQVSGHHSIENFLLFGTLRERYPTQKLRGLSEEFGKRWLRFAVCGWIRAVE